MSVPRQNHGNPLIWLALSLMVTGCAMQAPRDTVFTPATELPRHLASQPAPEWHVPIDAKEIDQALVLGPGRLLVTTLDLAGTGNIWRPSGKAVVLYDTGAGRPVWQTPLEGVIEEIHNLGYASGTILVNGRPAQDAPDEKAWVLLALSESTGTPAWVHHGRAGSQAQSFAAHRLAVVAHAEDQAVVISGLALADGRPLWITRLEGAVARTAGGTPTLGIAMAGDEILVSSAALAALNPTDGTLRWRSNISAGADIPNINTEGRPILVTSPSGVLALDLKDGRELWRHRPADGAVTVTAARSGDAIIVADRASDVASLQRLDAANGRVMWRALAPGLLRSPLAFGGDHALYTTRDRLVALDLRTGALRWQGVLPPALRSPSGLPDHIVPVGERWIIAREVGVAAFERQSGALAFAEFVAGAHAHTQAFLNLRNSGRRSALLGPSAALAGQYAAGAQLQATGNQIYNTARMTTDLTTRTSQAQYNYVRMQTQGVLDSPRSSSSQRMTALQTRESAARANYETQKAAARAERDAAVAGLVISLAGAAQQFGIMYRGKWVEAGFLLAEAQERQARTTHINSLQHGYYLRPFYRDGWGVTIVRLDDGRRADLFVSPPNEALLINAANLPMFLIDGSGNRLLAKGLGIGLKDVPTYDKVGWPATVGGMFGLPDNFRVAFPSVLAYDLNRLGFAPGRGEGLNVEYWPVLPAAEQALRMAILRSDVVEVKRLVAAGANPNLVDSLGLNCLFYAAMLDNKEVVTSLIGAGADALLRDAQGWLAVHYGFMTIQVPKATHSIIQAHDKQRAAH